MRCCPPLQKVQSVCVRTLQTVYSVSCFLHAQPIISPVDRPTDTSMDVCYSPTPTPHVSSYPEHGGSTLPRDAVVSLFQLHGVTSRKSSYSPPWVSEMANVLISKIVVLDVTVVCSVTLCSLAHRNLFCSEDGSRSSPHHPALRHFWSGGVRSTLHVTETCVARLSWFLMCAPSGGDVADVSDGYAASIVRVEVRRMTTTVLSALPNTLLCR